MTSQDRSHVFYPETSRALVDSLFPELSATEQKYLHLFCHGLGTKRISQLTGRRPDTISASLSKCCKKLDIPLPVSNLRTLYLVRLNSTIAIFLTIPTKYP